MHRFKLLTHKLKQTRVHSRKKKQQNVSQSFNKSIFIYTVRRLGPEHSHAHVLNGTSAPPGLNFHNLHMCWWPCTSMRTCETTHCANSVEAHSPCSTTTYTAHTKKRTKKRAKDRWRKKRPSNSYNHLLVATLFRSLARLTSPATVLILPLSLSIPFVVYIFIADGSKGIYLRAFPFRRCLSVFIRVCLMNMYLCGGGSIASK